MHLDPGIYVASFALSCQFDWSILHPICGHCLKLLAISLSVCCYRPIFKEVYLSRDSKVRQTVLRMGGNDGDFGAS